MFRWVVVGAFALSLTLSMFLRSQSLDAHRDRRALIATKRAGLERIGDTDLEVQRFQREKEMLRRRMDSVNALKHGGMAATVAALPKLTGLKFKKARVTRPGFIDVTNDAGATTTRKVTLQ